jgi:hypothetical protein
MPFPLGLRIIQCVKKNRPVETRTISNFQNEYESIKPSKNSKDNTKNTTKDNIIKNKKTKKKLKAKDSVESKEKLEEKDRVEEKTKKNKK